MLNNSLCQIGFTKLESGVYLELSKIGSQAVSVIAKRLGLNRTTTYSILKSLGKKGVVSSFRSNGMKYFSANDPNCLIGYVDRKCQTFDYYKSELMTLIPKFRNMRGEYNFSPPLVSYFEGIEGVKHVMYDALNAKTNYCAFLSLHKFLDYGLKDFLIKYKDLRIIDKKVKLRAMVPDTEEVRAFFNENYSEFPDMTEILYVNNPGLIKMFENQLSIYDSCVSMIHLENGEEYGVIIESKEIAAMQMAIFELAWAGCKLGADQ
ncbi:MAG: helix-turn-helix domain-containing protein [Candidatus Gracilibacteria bacterium]|jgi:sugar-specific transcriptional regulator TrmB